MRISFLLALLLGVTMTFTSCFNREKEPEQKEEETNVTIGEDVGKAVDEGINEGIAGMKDALGELEKQLTDANGGEKVEPVDFRELKAELPERINGMKRISAEGERSGWGGFKVSTANAEYEDGDKHLEISIVDAGGMMGLAKVGLAAWAQAEVDRETQDGYERTTTIDGYQAYEKFNNKTEDGQVSVIVNERFIVNIEGRNISARDLKSALDKLNLKKLEKMGG
jgi:hypothetical protein